MPQFEIESNGRLETTAVYFNGNQISGVKEIFLNMDEDGAFDAVIQYEGTDKVIYSKQIFSDFLPNLKIVEASFTEEDADSLRKLSVQSDGDIDTAEVFIDDEFAEGIKSLYLHIKGTETKTGLRSLFNKKTNIPDIQQFKAYIEYRNDDDSIDTEDIF